MWTNFQVALFQSLSTVIKSLSVNDNSSLATSCNKFAFDALNILNEPERNMFFSPFSICCALAMVLLGAEGNTAKQIRNTFYYEANENVGSLYKQLLEDFNHTSPESILKIANGLFGDKSLKVKGAFQNDMFEYFKAPLQQLDFKSDKAEVVINEWVSNKTHGRIKEIFEKGSLKKEGTELVSISAIYFAGEWLVQFNKTLTKKEVFKVAPGKNQEVDMMTLKQDLRYFYHHDLQTDFFELPYEGNRLFMFVAVPREEFGLNNVIKKLNAKKLKEAMWQTELFKFEVKFPRFKLKSTYELKKVFEKLKLTDIFDNRSNLPRISSEQLQISRIKHLAEIEVDEEGTLTSAATIVNSVSYVEGNFGTPPPPVINVDHPFYFAIIDGNSQLILFSGIVNDPKNEN